MKYKLPRSVAIFFWPIFTRQGGGMASLAPPGSATGILKKGLNDSGLGDSFVVS